MSSSSMSTARSTSRSSTDTDWWRHKNSGSSGAISNRPIKVGALMRIRPDGSWRPDDSVSSTSLSSPRMDFARSYRIVRQREPARRAQQQPGPESFFQCGNLAADRRQRTREGSRRTGQAAGVHNPHKGRHRRELIHVFYPSVFRKRACRTWPIPPQATTIYPVESSRKYGSSPCPQFPARPGTAEQGVGAVLTQAPTRFVRSFFPHGIGHARPGVDGAERGWISHATWICPDRGRAADSRDGCLALCRQR